MSEYFYVKNNSKIGPVQKDQMTQLRLREEIDDNTLIWTKDYGQVWKRYVDESSLTGQATPPPIPIQQIDYKDSPWIWVLCALPVVAAIIETTFYYDIPFATDSIESILIFGLIPNGVIAQIDEIVLKSRNRKQWNYNAGALGFVFIPLYIYFRQKRMGKSIYPLFIYIACFVASLLVYYDFESNL